MTALKRCRRAQQQLQHESQARQRLLAAAMQLPAKPPLTAQRQSAATFAHQPQCRCCADDQESNKITHAVCLNHPSHSTDIRQSTRGAHTRAASASSCTHAPGPARKLIRGLRSKHTRHLKQAIQGHKKLQAVVASSSTAQQALAFANIAAQAQQ